MDRGSRAAACGRTASIWCRGAGRRQDESTHLDSFLQGGRNRANLERSRAAYDENVAQFRQRVLVAFREVQDALTATQLLAEQAAGVHDTAAIKWLVDQQCPDGGWTAYRSDLSKPCPATDLTNFVGEDSNSTALAVQALHALGVTPKHDAVAYMKTEDDLRQAIETAYVHCQPGGAALFACPWPPLP